MFLTTRETVLLTELVNSPTPVSVNRMMNLLKVSRRTVYRELENLETSLASMGATLEKVARGRFSIQADEAAMTEIQAAILGEETQELSTLARQHAILLTLLQTKEPVSMHYFLETYCISNTTFYADIKQLETRIARIPLTISRNQGYEVTGSEKYRRLLMANILSMEINEYQFFHFTELTTSDHFFFQFIHAEHLVFAQKIVQPEVETLFPALSDRKLQHLILMLTIAMDRVTAGFYLADETYTGQMNKAFLNCSKRLFSKVAAETKQLYAVSEIVFFASLLSDFSNSFDEDFFDEHFDTQLAYAVKQLIEAVSQETEVNFFEDTNLYKMLLTHLSGVFSRAVLQEEDLTNPILERIMNQYQEIAAALRQALPQIFPQKNLSEEEIAYMVLHFANSLERSPKIMEVDIAGFSPSGLASTSMLEMRLRRYFPFINQIHFFRIADLGKVNVEENYDLVISTSLLPGYNGKYKLISPLLLDDEIRQLKEEFKRISHEKRSLRKAPVKKIGGEESYETVVAFMEEISKLLETFFIADLNNQADLAETVQQALAQLSADLITDSAIVCQQLMKRYEQAPIGIPQTEMALFHTSSTAVTQPVFCIFNLAQPLMIEGMDKKPMQLQRMLLMLAPMPIDETIGKILGKISGAIIMNDLNTEIFHSGNEAIVYQLLSSLLIEEMKG